MYRRAALDVEDITVDFVENELGRHDWSRNWPIYKARPHYQDRIATWLANAGHKATPAEIEHQLDQMLLTHPGRWR